MKAAVRVLGSRPDGRWADALRYVVAGGTVTLVYVGITLILAGPAGVEIQIAIPIAYALSICLHFSLQRWFVFSDVEHALPLGAQLRRYLPAAAAQYAFTAITTAVLPSALGVPERLVYVAAALTSSGGTFLFLRARVFHAERAST